MYKNEQCSRNGSRWSTATRFKKKRYLKKKDFLAPRTITTGARPSGGGGMETFGHLHFLLSPSFIITHYFIFLLLLSFHKLLSCCCSRAQAKTQRAFSLYLPVALGREERRKNLNEITLDSYGHVSIRRKEKSGPYKREAEDGGGGGHGKEWRCP